jgi:hypothetical protein
LRFQALVESAPLLGTIYSGDETMKGLTGEFGGTPDIFFKSNNRDGVASIVEDDEIRQIEQDKDPEEAFDEELDDADAEEEEDDELAQENAVDRAAERNSL